jgi:hypothetical protein
MTAGSEARSLAAAADLGRALHAGPAEVASVRELSDAAAHPFTSQISQGHGKGAWRVSQ